ncbi:hypothetical protein AB0M43_38255 [Longispora sp. NPDC051575]|uniref:hypothetical protein n=1 Tax=Longispora sp. NPDC051575 TaxID=3154943 RepID=UPI00343D7707
MEIDLSTELGRSEARAELIEAELLADGGTPTLKEWRDGYRLLGMSWPGDAEARRLLPIAE